jgi:hypothetical protein
LLSTLERDDPDTAAALGNRCKHEFAEARGELLKRALGRWALARELLEVSRVLDTPLVQALARGIARDDFEAVRPGIETYGKKHRLRAREANRVPAARAPSLHDAVGQMLPGNVRRSPRRERMRTFLMYVGLATLLVVRSCAHAGRRTEGPRALHVRPERHPRGRHRGGPHGPDQEPSDRGAPRPSDARPGRGCAPSDGAPQFIHATRCQTRQHSRGPTRSTSSSREPLARSSLERPQNSRRRSNPRRVTSLPVSASG